MASIQRRGRRYRIKYQPGGRDAPIRYISGIKTLGDATKELRRIEAMLSASEKVRPGRLMTLDELTQRYENDRLSGPQPNDEYTTRQAMQRVRSHAQRQHWRTTASVTPQAVTTWRQENPRSIRVGALIRAVLRYARAVHGQPVDDHSLVLLKPPKARRKPQPALWTDEEVGYVLAHARRLSDDAYALVHCSLTYGWRPITAARLRVRDLNGESITTRVKGHHEVSHLLLPETQALLAKLCQGRPPEAPLFVNPFTGQAFAEHGHHAIPEFFESVLCAPSYQGVKPYAITRLLDQMPARQAMQFTGHLTISQILRYTRVNDQTTRAALAVMQKAGPPGTTLPDTPRQSWPEKRRNARKSHT